MFKQTLTYTNFHGETRTKDFYFNLTAAELAEMDLRANGNFVERLKDIVATNDGDIIIPEFKKIIAQTYGIRSADGDIFDKSPEISRSFENHAAYSNFFLDMISEPSVAANFINAVMPADLQKKAAEMNERRAALEASGELPSVEQEKTASQLAREASEARLQGHKKPVQATQAATPAPAQPTQSETPAPVEPTPTDDASDGFDPSSMTHEQLLAYVEARNTK